VISGYNRASDDFRYWHISSNWWRRMNDCFTPARRRGATGRRTTAVGHQDAFLRPRLSARYRFSERTPAGTHGNGRDAPCGLVRDARPSDALALRPRQREPAAQRPTLRATISQRRWPRPLQPPRWHVPGFGTEPRAQFEPFIAETEHGHRLSAEFDGCQFKGRFVGHNPFPLVHGPMLGLIGWGGCAGPHFAAVVGRSLRRA
jgi:hypothetical protein